MKSKGILKVKALALVMAMIMAVSLTSCKGTGYANVEITSNGEGSVFTKVSIPDSIIQHLKGYGEFDLKSFLKSKDSSYSTEMADGEKYYIIKYSKDFSSMEELQQAAQELNSRIKFINITINSGYVNSRRKVEFVYKVDSNDGIINKITGTQPENWDNGISWLTQDDGITLELRVKISGGADIKAWGDHSQFVQDPGNGEVRAVIKSGNTAKEFHVEGTLMSTYANTGTGINDISISDSFPYVRNYPLGKFIDVTDGDWFKSDVEIAYRMGFINGVTDTEYMPYWAVTIAQAIQISANIVAAYYNETSLLSEMTQASKDAGMEWYQGAKDYLEDKQIIGKDSFTGGDNVDYMRVITRGELCNILSKIFPAQVYVKDETVDQNKAFSDLNNKSYVGYKWAIERLRQCGVVNGYDKNEFRPLNPVTRAQAAKFIHKLIDMEQRYSLQRVRFTSVTDD